MASLYSTGTEYTANEITLLRGVVGDIISVGLYHTLDPEEKPTVAQFTTVTLVPGSGPLSEDGKIDVLARVGARVEAGVLNLVPGDYQRWVLIVTTDEDVIRRPDVLEVL